MSNLRDYINDKTVIKDEIYKNFEYSVTCSICSEIMINPMMCMNCQTVYCKSCIDNWSKKSAYCTNRCKNTNYKKSILSQTFLSKLKFSQINLLRASQEINNAMDTVNSKSIN